MGNPLLHAERTHGIHLILHQRNQRGNHNRHTIHNQCRQLIAQRFTPAGRHQYKCILACEYVTDNCFLVPFETGKTEILFQSFMQQNTLFVSHLN